MMFGTSLALIAQEFQGRERGTALGIWGATTAAAVSTGPLVGGALVDALSWRWIFLVNVPIGLAALVVARLRLRESRDPAASVVDLRGVALLCPALFLLVYALIRGNEEGWGSAPIISCFAASALLLVLFVVASAAPPTRCSTSRCSASRPSPAPRSSPSRWRRRSSRCSSTSRSSSRTCWLHAVRGGAPVAAGHRADPVRLAAERPPDARVPARLLLGTGLAFVTVGLLLMGNLSDSSGWTAPLPGQILAGIGIGLSTPALASTAVGVVAPQLSGMSSGANNTARQLGSPPGSPASALSSSRRSSRRSARWSRARQRRRTSMSLRGLCVGWDRARIAGGAARRPREGCGAAHHAFVTGFNTVALVALLCGGGLRGGVCASSVAGLRGRRRGRRRPLAACHRRHEALQLVRVEVVALAASGCLSTGRARTGRPSRSPRARCPG